MWWIVFANVLVEGWSIEPYKHCFFDFSSEFLVLPPQNAEVVNSHGMTCDVMVVIHAGGGLGDVL